MARLLGPRGRRFTMTAPTSSLEQNKHPTPGVAAGHSGGWRQQGTSQNVRTHRMQTHLSFHSWFKPVDPEGSVSHTLGGPGV